VSRLLLRAPFAVALAASLAALWIQDWTRALPLGLFNERPPALRALSLGCLAAAAAGLALLLIDLGRERSLPAARALRGALAAFALLEALLYVLDVALVSRGAALAIGGPYRELRTRRGEWLFLKKPHAGSPWGLRGDVAFEREKAAGAARVLFLGDSYTEGSGSAPACNYPEVAAAALAERLGRPVQALNAGVAGYGPDDARRLLGLLIDEGYAFDAVVYALFLENDFTDNLPATERRAVAGINYRFPRSAFLRLFHPLNSRAFRYALLFARVGAGAAAVGNAQRRCGACDLTPGSAGPPAPELRTYAERRLQANYAPGARLAEELVAGAIRTMADSARSRSVPFVLVLFPDRVVVDAQLQAALAVDRGGYDLGRLRRFAREQLANVTQIDARAALAAGAENYRPAETHLNDLGNLRAGRYVGERLAELLPAGWGTRPP
jgi:lysophospholipase L1-like esterase